MLASKSDQITGYLDTVFTTMARDKLLPKYQFERRVDALLTPFLPTIVESWTGGIVSVVVPEFPLKKIDSHQSTNLDQLLFKRDGDESEWLFLELKTDAGSIEPAQLVTYEVAKVKGMRALVSDLELIQSKTKFKAKYQAVRDRLAGYDLDAPIRVLLLTVGPVTSSLSGLDLALEIHTFDELASLDVDVFPEAWDLFRRLLLPALMTGD